MKKSPNHFAVDFGNRRSPTFVSTRPGPDFHGAGVSAKCWWCWQNLCRLCLTKVWFQLAAVVAATGWWLSRRDHPSTLAMVSITLVLSSWMMSRERIRRSLAGDKPQWGLGGRIDDDWCTFRRPLLCLDEINEKRKAQERKDRIALRIGIICTGLAGIAGVIGFR